MQEALVDIERIIKDRRNELEGLNAQLSYEIGNIKSLSARIEKVNSSIQGLSKLVEFLNSKSGYVEMVKVGLISPKGASE